MPETECFRQFFPSLSCFLASTIKRPSLRIGPIPHIRRTLSLEPFRRAQSIYVWLAYCIAFSLAILAAFRVLRPYFGELTGRIHILSSSNGPDPASFCVLLGHHTTWWWWCTGSLAYCHHWDCDICLTSLPAERLWKQGRCRMYQFSKAVPLAEVSLPHCNLSFALKSMISGFSKLSIVVVPMGLPRWSHTVDHPRLIGLESIQPNVEFNIIYLHCKSTTFLKRRQMWTRGEAAAIPFLMVTSSPCVSCVGEAMVPLDSNPLPSWSVRRIATMSAQLLQWQMEGASSVLLRMKTIGTWEFSLWRNGSMCERFCVDFSAIQMWCLELGLSAQDKAGHTFWLVEQGLDVIPESEKAKLRIVPLLVSRSAQVVKISALGSHEPELLDKNWRLGHATLVFQSLKGASQRAGCGEHEGSLCYKQHHVAQAQETKPLRAGELLCWPPTMFEWKHNTTYLHAALDLLRHLNDISNCND